MGSEQAVESGDEDAAAEDDLDAGEDYDVHQEDDDMDTGEELEIEAKDEELLAVPVVLTPADAVQRDVDEEWEPEARADDRPRTTRRTAVSQYDCCYVFSNFYSNFWLFFGTL